VTQLLINSLIAGSFAALVAGGLALVYGVLGIFNMALGQLALIGGYLTWFFTSIVGLPFPVGALLGIILGGAVTWLCFEGFVAPFYRRHRFLPLVTTIALSMILDALILISFEERPRAIRFIDSSPMHLGDAVISLEQLMLILLTLLFLGMVAWILAATPFGRKVRATVQHPEAAESLGIPSALLHRIVFIGSGVLACLAGIYQGIDQNLTPTLAFPITIKAYAALIAGGKESLKGTIIAAYVIALFEQFAIGVPWYFGEYIAAGYQSTVALLVIIVFLLLRPQGLFGSITRTT